MGRECVWTVESYPDPDNCEEEDGNGCISAIDACWKLHCQSGRYDLRSREIDIARRWSSMLNNNFHGNATRIGSKEMMGTDLVKL